MTAIAPAAWYPDPDNATLQRYWDGAKWTEHRAPAVASTQTMIVNRGTNHAFHLVMTIVTFGLWLPVWIIVAIVNAVAA